MAGLPQRPVNVISDERRKELIELVREVNAQAGIAGEPTITPEELQDSIRRGGVRPEDNIGSRELMRMRYPHDPNG